MRTALGAGGRGFAHAFGNMQRRPLVAALATGAIAVSLMLVGLVYLAARNVESATAGWGGGVQMVVYLEEGVSEASADRIGAALLQVPAVERVEHVAPAMAMSRLRDSLGEHDELMEGIEEGMLPASIEVTLRRGVRDVAAAHPLLERLEATPGVEEVELMGAWVDRLTALVAALQYAGWFLLALAGFACIYTVTTTLRLSMQSRAREVDTLHLLGAPDRFVRAPMIIEGVLQGATGAAAAAVLLWLFFRATSDAIGRALSGSFGDVQPTFLPLSDVAILVAIGAGFGLIGSWLATGRRALA
ncbi:MAG: FtsX-like permease family protein [Deltaproteobacteria bacterium]|nr:FtsX-like permease family protein [Deltaproteobacteria bacterium]